MMKHLFQNREFQLNEILFENRNKNYGAYALRNESDHILAKSVLIGMALFATASIVPVAVSILKTEAKPTDGVIGETPVWVIPIEETVDTTPVLPTVVPPKSNVAQFDSTVPTPAKDPKVEKPAASIKQYDGAVAGTQTVAGDKPTSAYVPPVVAPTQGTATAPTTQPSVAPKTDEIVTHVDVEANFVGGINSFRNKVMGNFDVSQFEGAGETLRTTVTFVVERDGSISNVKASGPDAQFNKEAEKTIKNLRGAWSPAELKGQKVRSYFKFPISMMFE